MYIYILLAIAHAGKSFLFHQSNSKYGTMRYLCSNMLVNEHVNVVSLWTLALLFLIILGLSSDAMYSWISVVWTFISSVWHLILSYP